MDGKQPGGLPIGGRVSAARNLRCNMERQQNRRHAYEPQKLINGKHSSSPKVHFERRPPRQASIHALSHPLLAGEQLVRIGSARNREQRQN
jgi:hypothetical protein